MAEETQNNTTKEPLSSNKNTSEVDVKNKKLLIKYAVAIAVVGLICALFYSFLINYIKAIPNVRVPNVVGLDVNDAEFILKQENLEPLLGGSRFSEEATPNIILATDPEPGRTVKAGRKILYILNSGQEQISLQHLSGLLPEQASALLAEYNITIQQLEDAFSAEYKEGTIISTSPNGGEYIERNSTIDIIVSKGFPVTITINKIIEGSNKALVNISLQIPNSETNKKTNIKIVSVSGSIPKTLFNEDIPSGKELYFELEELLGNKIDVFFNDNLAKTALVLF